MQKNNEGTTAICRTKQRESGLELMRIVLMLAIIAHHYVVNSGVSSLMNLGSPNQNQTFLVLWGMWGKTAINAFVLITGYFMCTSRLTWRKLLKLWLQIKFYRIGICILFAALGMYTLNLQTITFQLFSNAMGAGNGFNASFLMMYCLIPFLNLMVKKFDRRQLLHLTAFLLFLFSGLSTFFNNGYIFNEVFWYATLYLVAAYIRLYPHRWMNDRQTTAKVLALFVGLAYLSVIAILIMLQTNAFASILSKQYNRPTFCYYFLSDSCKLLAFCVGVSVFLFFKNLRLGYVPLVNTIASVSYGVLLIHAHSSVMREWLWVDVFNVPGMFDASLPLLVAQALLAPILVYVVCGTIDFLRIYFLERPLFSMIDRHYEEIDTRLKGAVGKLETFAGRFV